MKCKFSVGQNVWVKAQGFPEWPAKILKFYNDEHRNYRVKFLGERSTANIMEQLIWPFQEYFHQFSKGSNQTKFLKGIKEARASIAKQQGRGGGKSSEKSVTEISSTVGDKKKKPVKTPVEIKEEEEEEELRPRIRSRRAVAATPEPTTVSAKPKATEDQPPKDLRSHASKRELLRQKLDTKEQKQPETVEAQKPTEVPKTQPMISTERYDENRRATRSRVAEAEQTQSVQFTGRTNTKRVHRQNPPSNSTANAKSTNSNSNDTKSSQIKQAHEQPQKKAEKVAVAVVKEQQVAPDVMFVKQEPNADKLRSLQAYKNLQARLEQTMLFMVFLKSHTLTNQSSSFCPRIGPEEIRKEIALCLSLDSSQIEGEHYASSKIGGLWSFILNSICGISGFEAETEAIRQRIQQVKVKVWERITDTGRYEGLLQKHSNDLRDLRKIKEQKTN